MNKGKFTRPALSNFEKEKLANQFINSLPGSKEKIEEIKKDSKFRVNEKEKSKAVILRLPQSLHSDLTEISNITSLSINAICIEFLRPQVKNKLKELKE